MQLWPHQERAIAEVLAAIARGERRILLVIPTGGGKTRTACFLIDLWAGQGKKVAVYANRKLLVDQLVRVLTEHDIDHGVRAAGWSDEGADFAVQICSLQTENARSLKPAKCKACKGEKIDALGDACSTCRGAGVVAPLWQLHGADFAFIDEAHVNANDLAGAILKSHHDDGAAYVGLTATPLGVAHLYDTLIEAGTTSELRECGALVMAHHYGPDEPDIKESAKAAKLLEQGKELSEEEQQKYLGKVNPTLFGRVIENFERLNPEAKPTIGFAAGVAESLWFAEQFVAAGYTAAHIAADGIWINGEWHPNDGATRDTVRNASRDGSIQVVWNRFVLREGADWPWLQHGIFACLFGVQGYLQAGGRLLRAFPGKTHCTIQDHGGNWWRHGSLNENRHWELDWTAHMLSGLRASRMRDGKLKEPARCKKCSRILFGRECPCGWKAAEGSRVSRPVVQSDGTLRMTQAAFYRPRQYADSKSAATLWERMYWRARSEKWNATFLQAEAMFAAENRWVYPARTLPFMPRDEYDFFQKVAHVPMHLLIPKPEPEPAPARDDDAPCFDYPE